MADDDQKMHFSTDQSEGPCKNLMNHNYECKLNNQNQITVNSKEYALRTRICNGELQHACDTGGSKMTNFQNENVEYL